MKDKNERVFLGYNANGDNCFFAENSGDRVILSEAEIMDATSAPRMLIQVFNLDACLLRALHRYIEELLLFRSMAKQIEAEAARAVKLP